MRVLILAAAAAIVAAPAFAADVNGAAGNAAQPDVTMPAAGDSAGGGMKMSNQSRHANPQPAEQSPQGDTTQDSKVK